GHLVLAVAQQILERRRLAEQRAARDLRADVALSGEPVALRAGAGEGLLADRRAARLVQRKELLVKASGDDGDVSPHRRVLDAAELRALAGVHTDLHRLEPGRVRPARNRVDLSPQLRDPPAVCD